MKYLRASNALRRIASTFFIACAITHFSAAQEPEKTPEPAVPRKISDGVYQLGEIVIDKNKNTITFPGSINMDKGEMEYMLVQDGGKTHESLLVTKVQPAHIHIAMLLLGAKVPQQPAIAAPPPDAIDAQYLKTAPKPAGDNVLLLLRWKDGEKQIEVHAEDMMFDQVKKETMSRGPWVYNGSILSAGIFLAQKERSIASLIIDPAALINNTRPDSDNDQAWSVLTEKTPKAGTPVEICIELLPADKKAEP